MSREVRGGRKFMRTIIFLKRYVCQYCVALKTCKRTPFLMYFDTNHTWKWIVSHLLANVPPHAKCWQTYPPSDLAGLIVIRCWLFQFSLLYSVLHSLSCFWCPWCIFYNKSLIRISDSESAYLILYGNMA